MFKRFLKINIVFLKYIWKYLTSKQPNKTKLLSIYNLLGSYLQANIQCYKEVFNYLDPMWWVARENYLKQKKNYDFFSKVVQALAICQKNLDKNGISRTEQRQFFNELFKYPDRRRQLIDNLVKKYNFKI